VFWGIDVGYKLWTVLYFEILSVREKEFPYNITSEREGFTLLTLSRDWHSLKTVKFIWYNMDLLIVPWYCNWSVFASPSEAKLRIILRCVFFFCSTDDSRYTCFRCPHFRISAVLSQYPEHQYPICDHGRSCCAGPLSCVRFHWLAPPFWLRGLQIKVCHGVRLRKSTGIYMLPVLRVLDMRCDSQESNPRV
jgi:hypothetical protein